MMNPNSSSLMELTSPNGLIYTILVKIPLLKRVIDSYSTFSRKKKTLVGFLVGIAFAGLYYTLTTLSKKNKIRPNRLNQSPSFRSQEILAKTQPIRQLKGLKISCSTMGTLFTIDPKGDQKSLVAIPSQISALLKLLPTNDIYLITKVQNDEKEREVMQLLEETGILWAGMNPSKVLFCSTDEGRVHMARQLGVHLHIDDDLQVIKMLRPHVPQLLHVSSIAEEVSYIQELNVIKATNLSQYVMSFSKTKEELPIKEWQNSQ